MIPGLPNLGDKVRVSFAQIGSSVRIREMKCGDFLVMFRVQVMLLDLFVKVRGQVMLLVHLIETSKFSTVNFKQLLRIEESDAIYVVKQVTSSEYVVMACPSDVGTVDHSATSRNRVLFVETRT